MQRCHILCNFETRGPRCEYWLVFLGTGVTIACNDAIFYVILKQEGQDGPKLLT